MIVLSGVSFSYSAGAKAIRELSTEIEPAKVTAVVGPNGSGKSTLARMTAGLILPTDGAITIDGEDTRSADPMRIRSLVGLAWQNPDNQMVCSVVEDDIAFGPENLGLSVDEIGRRTTEALVTLGLAHLRSTSVHRLSSAQKQVLAVAGALAMEPKYLILDEVTARLDPVSAHHLLDGVLAWADRKCAAVIMITHQMPEVLRADKITVLDTHVDGGGVLVVEGSPRTVLADAGLTERMKLETPLHDAMTRLTGLGVHLDGVPETVEQLVDLLCR